MSSDVVIIGGGHNGLVCAAYLAAAGLKVTVLERRHVVGGAAVTEEFHPGFRNSVASYTVSLLNPKVIRRPGAEGAWAADRRARDREFPAAAGRALPEVRRGADEGGGGEVLGARCGATRRVSGAAGRHRRRASRAGAGDAAERRGGGLARAAGADEGGRARPARRRARRGDAARADRPVPEVGGRLPRWLVRERSDQGRSTASTASSAPTRAPTRPAPPTCSSTTPSAR